jgi:hypothetical protein
MDDFFSYCLIFIKKKTRLQFLWDADRVQLMWFYPYRLDWESFLRLF